jgi:hypothetical protein
MSLGESSKIVTINHTNSPYTVLPTDGTIVCDQTTDHVIVNLPPAASYTGKKYIAKVKGTTNTVYITPVAPDTIDGETTVNLNTQYAYREIQSDGDNWYVTGQYGTSIPYRNPNIPSASALSSYVVTPTDANYTMTDNGNDFTFGYTGSVTQNYPIGLYRPGGLGGSGAFNFEVQFVPNTALANFVGIGFRDDSGGVGALSVWGIRITSGNYHVDTRSLLE